MPDSAQLPATSLYSQLPGDLPALQLWKRQATSSTLRLCAVGDVGLSGRIFLQAQTTGFQKPFDEVAPLFRTADIVFANLETPLLTDAHPQKLFCGPVEGARELARAGFNLLHLANNHILDYGSAGLASTLSACHDAGITPLGAGYQKATLQQPVIIQRDNLRLAFLGCGHTLQAQSGAGPFFWEFDEASLLHAVRSVRSQGDALIVSIHAGLMYLDYPDPALKTYAEQLLNQGANCVLMHHAHVLQGVQVVGQGRVICYNLGNFLLDWQEGNVKADIMAKEQNEGAVLVFEFDRFGICSAVVLPTCVDDCLSVHWATGERGVAILERLQRISEALHDDYQSAFLEQRAERNAGHSLKVICYHLRRGNWSIVWRLLRRLRLVHLRLAAIWLKGQVYRRLPKIMRKQQCSPKPSSSYKAGK